MRKTAVFKNNNQTLYVYSKLKSIKSIIYYKFLKTQYLQRILVYTKISNK